MICGTVLCLGDSLTFGARSPRAYPDLLVPLLDARSAGTRWATLNRSVCGETAWQVLQRTPGAVRELAGLFGAKWCVVLAGTNDAKGGGRGGEGLRDLEDLLHQIVHWPLRYGIPTALCTYPPVLAEMPEFGGGARTWLRAASQVVREVAASYDEVPTADGRCCRMPVVDLEAHVLPVHLADGVHLTRQGYEEVALLVADAILPAQGA